MRAIWGICIGAALVAAGLVAWTYTVEQDGVRVVGLLFLLTDVVMAMLLFVAVAVLSAQDDRGVLAAHWQAWRGHMPRFAVWVSATTVVVGLVLSALYLHLTLPIDEDHGRYWLSVSKFDKAPASREEYLVSYAQARRLIGAGAVLLLGVASVAFSVLFIRPGAGTSRTTGRP